MGVFDTITLDKSVWPLLPLPKKLGELKPEDIFSESRRGDWQTKSLGKGMSHFLLKKRRGKITLDHRKCKQTWVEDKSYFGGGYYQTISQKNIRHKHTGTICFYTGVDLDQFENDYWIEYEALFSNGICKNIRLKEYRSHSNKSRKETRAQLSLEAAQQAIYLGTRLGKLELFLNKLIWPAQKFIRNHVPKLLNTIQFFRFNFQR